MQVSIRDVGAVCNFLSSVSLQQKIEATRRTSVAAQFIWQAKENTSLRRGQANPKDMKRREVPGSILAPLFMFFSPPTEPTLFKLG